MAFCEAVRTYHTHKEEFRPFAALVITVSHGDRNRGPRKNGDSDREGRSFKGRKTLYLQRKRMLTITATVPVPVADFFLLYSHQLQPLRLVASR